MGIILGFCFRTTPNSIKPINLNLFSKVCQYNGKTYKSDESFKNSCNNCGCEDGKVTCTLMACKKNKIGSVSINNPPKLISFFKIHTNIKQTTYFLTLSPTRHAKDHIDNSLRHQGTAL